MHSLLPQVDEIGYLTVIGCVGNMAASFLFGYLFDYISSKRLVLFLAALVSAGTYLFFLPAKTKGELFMAQFTISAGAGLLYTVHCAMVSATYIKENKHKQQRKSP